MDGKLIYVRTDSSPKDKLDYEDEKWLWLDLTVPKFKYVYRHNEWYKWHMVQDRHNKWHKKGLKKGSWDVDEEWENKPEIQKYLEEERKKIKDRKPLKGMWAVRYNHALMDSNPVGSYIMPLGITDIKLTEEVFDLARRVWLGYKKNRCEFANTPHLSYEVYVDEKLWEMNKKDRKRINKISSEIFRGYAESMY